MKVVGVDVGPAKGGHVCEDGSPLPRMTPQALETYLEGLPDDVLIAWDAPLTGPPNPEGWTNGMDLTVRPIERFFLKHGRFHPPPGISVLPYSGCSHWTITRRLLGLPRVGKFDLKDDLPFRLVTSDRERPRTGRHVVEVHPAMALWRWCCGSYGGPWEYKKDKGCRVEVCRLMSSRIGTDLTTDTNDQLDAWTAWYLARCWLDGRGVMMLGNSSMGSFLMPDEPDLQKKFADQYGNGTN
jgi:hypothetical protein